MIKFSGGVFHTEPGTYITDEPRARLKQAGFVFHWGDSRCRQSCPGCTAELTPKVWVTANHLALSGLQDLLASSALAHFERLAAQIDESRRMAASIDVPAPPGCTYKEYQLAAIAYAMQRTHVLFADEMGLGKTISAIGWINALGNEARTVLIVCPASIKLNWRDECEKWLISKRRIEVVSSPSPVSVDSDIVIVNYERLVGPRQKPVLDSLQSVLWDMLIVDEAHRIKTMKAQRSVAILGARQSRSCKARPGLADIATRVAFLSGSPIPNRPKEFYPIAQLLAPRVFGNEWQFLTRYCEGPASTFWKKGPDGVAKQQIARNFDGARNLEELGSLARTNFMVRRLKQDVWAEMPPKTRQIIPLVPTSKARWLDAELEDALIAEHGSFEQAVLDLTGPKGHIPLGQIAKIRKELALIKIPLAIEFIDLVLDQQAKVIVFAHHQAVIEELYKHYRHIAVVVYGPTSEKERKKSIDEFQTDPSVRLFLGSSAAGEGITLTASSHVIFVESSWVPGDVAQREDRAHRIGQKHPVLIQHLVWDGTVEAQMIRTVVRKQKTIDKILNN